ncbi:hypothetical protein [Desulfovirgula thermocuniculi]|uniref:hypothetical protein n=1 Tax=Desulfovirgula thermocuniculi TaxID=348842 RepID=UPI0004129E73|nr:hypothetical protein [Desulfovirgula thermocuniculi]
MLPCAMNVAAYPCGIDPGRCPLADVPGYRAEPDPERLLLEHFQKPGTAIVFVPDAGYGRNALAAKLRGAGVEVVEVAWGAKADPEAARELAERMASARARGERIALFAPGVEELRRWSEGGLKTTGGDQGRPALRYVEGGWTLFWNMIRIGSSPAANHLVAVAAPFSEEDLKYLKQMPGRATVVFLPPGR